MAYQHGITILEQATGLTAPIEGDSALQIVFGTAPVNLAEDPYSVTNVPIIAHSYAEAVKQLGFSYDFQKYTLCQSIYASFQLSAVAPVIFVNVLNPKKHKKQNTASTVTVENMQATVQIGGILADTVSVKKDTESGTALKVDTDYVTEFDSDGYLVITLTATGAGKDAKSLSVTSTSIDPTAVTAADVVGGYNVSTGAETGMELVRQIYPKFGMTPGLLLAPGWSHDPDVGLVLAAKCVEINGVFKCECIIDIDSTSKGAVVYTDVKAKKEGAGVSGEHVYPLWPCFRAGSYILWASAVTAARIAYLDAANDNVPYLSPSNKTISITGTCLADGTEVILDRVQANSLNGVGVTTAVNENGWKLWGNNTAAYPSSTDPKDRWFCCRRFFSWWGNSFALTYIQHVDGPISVQLVENIVDSENIRGNSYVAQGKCAGAHIDFRAEENTATDIISGEVKFHQMLAPFVPAEHITNTLEFDPDMLYASINGGSN